jgi:hypothetical protein
VVVGTSNLGLVPAAEAGKRPGSMLDCCRSEARSKMPFGNGSTFGSVVACSHEHKGLSQWWWARGIWAWCLPQRQANARAACRIVAEAKHAARWFVRVFVAESSEHGW